MPPQVLRALFRTSAPERLKCSLEGATELPFPAEQVPGLCKAPFPGKSTQRAIFSASKRMKVIEYILVYSG